MRRSAAATGQARQQALDAGQARILEMIARGAPAARVLKAIVVLIEARAPDVLASILVLDAEGRRVRHGAAARLPRAYMRRIDGQPIGPRAGACGAAAYLRRSVVCADIRTDPRWAAYREAAAPFGLRACWSTPIFDAKRRVLGTFALYFRKPGRPAARHRREIGVATHLASVALTHAREKDEHARLVHALGERVKELTVLHKWAGLLQQDTPVDAKLFARLAALLPPGWQYPEVCVARVAYGELEARTRGWREVPARQAAPFRTADGTEGCIEIAYLEARPAAAEGPFLAEERTLLDSLADMLAVHVERHRAQIRLRDREAMFRAIFDNAGIGVTLVDLEGRIAACNPALARMLGYAEAELNGMTVSAITHPEDIASSATLYRSLATGQLGHYQLVKRYLRKDGATVWAQLTASILPRPGRAPRFSIGMIEDISARKLAEQALLESAQRFRLLAESSPDATLIHQDERIVFVNRAMLDLMRAADAAQLVGQPATFMLPPPLVEGARKRIAALYAGTPQPRAEQAYLRLDGTAVDVEVAAAPIALDGRPAAQVTVRDVTSRKQAEAALRESERRFRGILEGMTVGFVAFDRELRFTYVNARAEALLQRSAESLLGQRYAEAFPEAVGSTFEQAYHRALLENVAVQAEEYFVPWQRWFEQRVDPTPDGLSVFFQDITERKGSEARIQHLATHDALTGLPNRTLAHDRITQAIFHARRGGRQLAVMYLDLDRFKVINDGFGHPVGDAVLRACAARLKDLVRNGDTVARQSGDEFMMLLADLRHSSDAYIVGQKVLDAFSRALEVEGRELHVTPSIGVSLFPQDGQSADELIRNADVAMYRAKELGRNNYQFFTREMSEETQRRVAIETELRAAIARGQLHLAYQPKADLASGRIAGCEALLRWTHPSLGVISPARFIPIAEDSGLIVPIGDWALRTACTQAKAWIDAGFGPLSVAVNVSPRQFLQQDVVAWVMTVLRETDLPPECLELELTETLIARDVEKVIATVDRLKSAGVRLSIDDFGTGYSSLSYLKRFRVDTLKIDQSFVRNLASEQDDATIALAVIDLAHNLRMTAVAEGVETEAQCRFLRDHGCDAIQGYFFSKPVPAEELGAQLAARRTLQLPG
ncbi:MAG TPA: EAL domain-containing protein [Burkholderiales bacterium]|nr:EAL domain-containing protein [Burkholderiales bacterium]